MVVVLFAVPSKEACSMNDLIRGPGSFTAMSVPFRSWTFSFWQLINVPDRIEIDAMALSAMRLCVLRSAFCVLRSAFCVPWYSFLLRYSRLAKVQLGERGVFRRRTSSTILGMQPFQDHASSRSHVPSRCSCLARVHRGPTPDLGAGLHTPTGLGARSPSGVEPALCAAAVPSALEYVRPGPVDLRPWVGGRHAGWNVAGVDPSGSALPGAAHGPAAGPARS